MMSRSGGNQIRLREGVPDLPSLFDEKSSLEHDVFGNLQNTLL